MFPIGKFIFNALIKTPNSNTLELLSARTDQSESANLTQNEKDALLAFMLTLTDNTLATEERFSDPFVD